MINMDMTTKGQKKTLIALIILLRYHGAFSWKEALLLCRSINATLPEFYSRKEQEDFIAVLKSGDVFPIKNMYIGLYKQAKVGVLSFIDTS